MSEHYWLMTRSLTSCSQSLSTQMGYVSTKSFEHCCCWSLPVEMSPMAVNDTDPRYELALGWKSGSWHDY